MSLRVTRIIFFEVLAVVMTAMTYILGAPLLKVVRRRLGRGGFWALLALVSAGLWTVQAELLAAAFFTLGALVGVFEEFEEMGLSFNLSLFFTLLINSLLSAGAFALWVSRTPRWFQAITDLMVASLKPVVEMNPLVQINYDQLIAQLPSVILIAWIVSAYVAVLLEDRFLRSTAAEGEATPERPPMRAQLAKLRMPDVCVWLFIAALLGRYGGFLPKVGENIATNVWNVCAVLFFLQGLAVVNKFLESLRMGPILQFLFMFVAVVQFYFVGLIGLMDFWLEFRGRMEKKQAGAFNREV